MGEFAETVDRLIHEGWSVQEIAAELGATVADVRAAFNTGDADPGLRLAFDRKLAEIDALTSPIPNWWEREQEHQRLLAQLYEQATDRDERKALSEAHQAWLDRRYDAAFSDLPDGTAIVSHQGVHLSRGRFIPWRALRPRSVASALVTPIVRAAPRPRARRERHVARATSSGDSGDSSGESDPPALARLSRAIRRARFERVPGSLAVRLVFRPERREGE